jgi:hypothetical protein
MDDERKNRFAARRDWRLLVGAILAMAFLAAVVAYKYTGDFTGLATFGTSGRTVTR